MKKPRLGFLGMGWIGRKRLEAMIAAACGDIVAIADPVMQDQANLQALAPRAVLSGSLEELLRQNIDGVIVATPSALHAEQATMALEAGCAVFCQKPLGRSLAEVQTIIAVARRSDRLLGIDLSYRHTKALLAVRELVQSGALGRVFGAELAFHNAYGPDKPWYYEAQLSGGGCVLDLGVHLVDAALWILGGSVAGVSSRLFHRGQPLPDLHRTVEDYATAHIEFVSGTSVQLACSWNLHAGRPAIIEMIFHGTAGGVAFRNIEGSFTEFRAEHFCQTRSEVLVTPPDDWGGRAAIAWARQLAKSPTYDLAVEQHQEVARVLDAIYAPTTCPISLKSRAA